MYRPKLKESLTFESCTNEGDAMGARTYAAGVTVKCLVEYIEKNIKDFNDNESISSACIWAPYTLSIKRSDRFTLPNGEKPYIGSIEKKTNKRTGKVMYIEVYVGRVKPGEAML